MAGSWADRPFLAIDTETTGVDPFTDRVVEVAAVTIDPDSSVHEPWSIVVDPGVEIPAGAAEVHGITTDRARAEGVSPKLALSALSERIWRHVESHAGQAPLVAFNCRFDWPLLMAEAARHGVGDFPVLAPMVDPMLLDRLCDRFRKGKRQLVLVAEHYGVDLDPEAAHGALADATAAGQVMRRIIDTFPDLRKMTLPGIWLHQTHGHEQWRAGFEDYLRCNKDPQARIVPGWPVPVDPERAR